MLEEVTNRILDQFNLKWRELFDIKLNDSEIRFAKFISDDYYRFIRSLPEQVHASPLKTLLKEIDQLDRTLVKLRRELNELPSVNEHIEELMNRRDSLNTKLGRIEKEIEDIDLRIDRLKQDIKQLEGQIDRLKDKLKDYPDLEKLYDFAEKVKKTLDEYINTLLNIKRKEFEEKLTEIFKDLFYKTREIEKVEVRGDFSIELVDKTGRYIRKDKLSAGEKQILAFAILRTMEELTGKAHFVVIDTPMGRLDDHYKRLLVEKVFPSLSNQVILLSTPEEIRDTYYDQLKNNISKEYTLVYKVGEFHSELKDGYFREGYINGEEY